MAVQKRSALTPHSAEDDVETLLAQSSAVEAATTAVRGGHQPPAHAHAPAQQQQQGAGQQAGSAGQGPGRAGQGPGSRPPSAANTTGGRGRWGQRLRLSLAPRRGGSGAAGNAVAQGAQPQQPQWDRRHGPGAGERAGAGRDEEPRPGDHAHGGACAGTLVRVLVVARSTCEGCCKLLTGEGTCNRSKGSLGDIILKQGRALLRFNPVVVLMYCLLALLCKHTRCWDLLYVRRQLARGVT